MPSIRTVVAESPPSPRCDRRVRSLAEADLVAALIGGIVEPVRAARDLLLDEIGDPVAFVPAAGGRERAGLKWGGPAGRKDQG